MPKLKTYRFTWKDGSESRIMAINSLYAVKFLAYKRKCDLFDVIHLFDSMERIEES